MKIGNVDLDSEVLIIAEIGNNHEGDVQLAEDLIAKAAEAGAQAVKFQTIIPERLVGPQEQGRLAQLRRFQLSPGDHARLAATASRHGVMFLSTPFCIEAVSLLDALVPAFKIASGDNDFVLLLEAVAETGRPVLLSAGMTDTAGVSSAAGILMRVWDAKGVAPGLVILHCVSVYPTPLAEANLRSITDLARLGHTVGYSDHTLGIDAAVLSVALGARVIEKHFTDSKSRTTFRDHALAADPADLRELVDRVREASAMLGDGVKAVTASERLTMATARRSVVARRDLSAGHVLSRQDLDWLRPGGGLAPGNESEILGRALRAFVAAGTRLDRNSVQ